MIENKLKFFFKNQIWHLGGTILLFYIAAQLIDFTINPNNLFGLSAKDWFILSMAIPLIHQTYIWACWRSELCWKTITRTIGFKPCVTVFFIIGLLRFSCIGLCIVDYGSLYEPGLLAWILGIIIFIPGAYTMYSVRKYFGFLRAAGADHFFPEYKHLPFEKRGIFKWSSNAMYLFGIAIFFSFAVSSGSKAGFIFAIYSYISIWLHYFCTEKEDFKDIYGAIK